MESFQNFVNKILPPDNFGPGWRKVSTTDEELGVLVEPHQAGAGKVKLVLSKFLRHISTDRNSFKIFMFILINLSFTFVEFIVGYWSNSLGLISDSGHMLFDCTALLISLIAAFVASFKTNKEFTYGYGRIEVISGFVNAVFLLLIAVSVLLEGFYRLFSPPDVHTQHLLPVAVGGLLVNVVGLVFFHEHHSHSHSSGNCPHAKQNSNMHGVFLHVLADTLGSVGVILSAILIKLYNWTISDPICAIFISVLIFLSAIPLIKITGLQLLQATPIEVRKKVQCEIKKLLRSEPSVFEVRAAHFWMHTNNTLVGSLKVRVSTTANQKQLLKKIRSSFGWKSQIGCRNLTIEIEKFEQGVQHILQASTGSDDNSPGTQISGNQSYSHAHSHSHSHSKCHSHSHSKCDS